MSLTRIQSRACLRWPALVTALVAAVALSLALAGAGSPARVEAAGSADAITIRVQGSALGNITTSPLTLAPGFSQAISDYALGCQAGTNTVNFTFTAVAGGTIQVGASSGSQVTKSVDLVEDQAVIVQSPDPANPSRAMVKQWIRCLPHNIPRVDVTKPGNATPGWYLTGNLSQSATAQTYSMILDQNGTPVWYQRIAGNGPSANLTRLSDRMLGWTTNSGGGGFGKDPNDSWRFYDLTNNSMRLVKTPTLPVDFHELQPLSNGNYLMFATPLRSMDLSSIGLGPDRQVVDCLIQEVNNAGGLVWEWRASNHIPVSESQNRDPSNVNGQTAYDLYHCNSADPNEATGRILLSARHTSAVYLINKATGLIEWKLNGNAVVGDGAQKLTVVNDAQGGFFGQHDARFQPNGDISLFDNHTFAAGAARGVVYHIDTTAGTGTLTWEYRSPDGQHSNATGAFTRAADGSAVIAWGIMPNAPLLTEVDGAGQVLLSMRFSLGEQAYRAVKKPITAFDANLLRQTAGFPPGNGAPPVVTVPANQTLEATSTAGAPYSFTASANDDVDGARPVTCNPPSGSTFPLGPSNTPETTTVTCSATDLQGNTGFSNFTVTVRDTTKPVVTVPANQTLEATSAAGASYSFTASATDNLDGSRSVTCNPVSGSTFPLGPGQAPKTTTVTCTATDVAGNIGTRTFAVTVRDTTAPTLTVPANATINATSTAGATYTFSANATDAVDATAAVNCAPASGSTFPLASNFGTRTTTVNCTATDDAGNTSAVQTLTVTIRGAVDQLNTVLVAVTGQGPGKTLENSVKSARDNVLAGRISSACSDLSTFISTVQSQSGKKIAAADATQFITDARRIRAVLGC